MARILDPAAGRLELYGLAKSNRLALLIGTGLSIASAPSRRAQLTWTGLLNDALSHIKRLGMSGDSLARAAEWQKRLDELHRLPSAEQSLVMLNAASFVRGEFAQATALVGWLRSAVGTIHIEIPEPLRNLARLASSHNLLVMTTNYDHLIEEATGRSPCTWTDAMGIEAEFRSERRTRILHLHGHWDNAASVVLAKTDYDSILRNQDIQPLLRSVCFHYSFLFVGCGAGLTDPNWSAMLLFDATTRRWSSFQHYRLCATSELDAAREQHAGHNITLVEYGRDYSYLPSFLLEISTGENVQRSIRRVLPPL